MLTGSMMIGRFGMTMTGVTSGFARLMIMHKVGRSSFVSALERGNQEPRKSGATPPHSGAGQNLPDRPHCEFTTGARRHKWLTKAPRGYAIHRYGISSEER